MILIRVSAMMEELTPLGHAFALAVKADAGESKTKPVCFYSASPFNSRGTSPDRPAA